MAVRKHDTIPSARPTRRADTGAVRLSQRDIDGLLPAGEHYGAPFDLLAAALRVQPERLPSIAARWRRAGYAATGRLGPGPGWCWLTRDGMTATGLGFPATQPALARLAHIRAVLAARLWMQASPAWRDGCPCRLLCGAGARRVAIWPDEARLSMWDLAPADLAVLLYQMMSMDPFDALGLPARPDLTDEQVRAARRAIAAATHPDRADGGDLARYTAASAAYAELRTPWSRSEAFTDLTGPADQASAEAEAVTAPLPASPPKPCRPARPGRRSSHCASSQPGFAAAARCAWPSAPASPPRCRWPCCS